MENQCTTCCQGYFVAMRKKPINQYGFNWYEHKCTVCTSRKYLIKKYNLTTKK